MTAVPTEVLTVCDGRLARHAPQETGARREVRGACGVGLRPLHAPATPTSPTDRRRRSAQCSMRR